MWDIFQSNNLIKNYDLICTSYWCFFFGSNTLCDDCVISGYEFLNPSLRNFHTSWREQLNCAFIFNLNHIKQKFHTKRKKDRIITNNNTCKRDEKRQYTKKGPRFHISTVQHEWKMIAAQKDLTPMVFPLSASAPSRSTQGIKTHAPLIRRLGTLTKWLASQMLVWILTGFST